MLRELLVAVVIVAPHTVCEDCECGVGEGRSTVLFRAQVQLKLIIPFF